MGFLNQYGLGDEYKLNIECNHATLAGHSCEHELQVSVVARQLLWQIPSPCVPVPLKTTCHASSHACPRYNAWQGTRCCHAYNYVRQVTCHRCNLGSEITSTK